MGIFDKALARIAGEVVKAMPAPSVGGAVGVNVPLEREGEWASVPFAPAMPLIPSSINPSGERGRPDPRRWEFEVAQNINVSGGRLVPFRVLRQSSEQIDIVRRCIEVLKNKMAGLDWDISLTPTAVEKIMAERSVNQVRAAQLAKDEFSAEMNRLRDFWETPDINNGMDFVSWLTMLLEDLLVLDAVAIWPQQTVGGELKALQLIDAATIKPLIDDRGMRPTAPHAAFQQILYGFPRTEFSAPTENLEADGEFTSDELSYLVRNRRTHSVYGYSPVERALPLADLYLRRQQWLRAEYTDGVMPELMFKTDANFGNNPELLRAYENIFNDDLAGQTEQRKRARLLPAGLDPVQFDGYGEKFSDVLDEYLVTSICGHFGVLPTEIGFTGKSGLGGTSVHEGQAETSEVLGLLPLAQWVARQISQLSYVYLGMPRELEFKFQPSARQDDKSIALAEDVRIRNGSLTLNEARSKNGLPLLDANYADQPIFVAMGAFALTDEGPAPFGNAFTDTPPNQSVDVAEEEPSVTPAVEVKSSLPFDIEELRRFKKWLKKSPNKSFQFDHVSKEHADVLNKFVVEKDFESAALYAERYESIKTAVPGPAEVEEALSRLAVLPNPAHPELAGKEEKFVESPWAVVDVPTVDPNVWDNAKVELINIADLKATDAWMRRKNVRKHIENMGQAVTPFRSYALVVVKDGDSIIIDGHHRLFAKWLLGQETAPVWKVEI
jgi:Phage portal protein